MTLRLPAYDSKQGPLVFHPPGIVSVRNRGGGRLEAKRETDPEWEEISLEEDFLLVTPTQLIFWVNASAAPSGKKAAVLRAVNKLRRRTLAVDANGNLLSKSVSARRVAASTWTPLQKRTPLVSGGWVKVGDQTRVIRFMIPDNVRGGIKLNTEAVNTNDGTPLGQSMSFPLQGLMDEGAHYGWPVPVSPSVKGRVKPMSYRVDNTQGNRWEFLPGSRTGESASIPAKSGYFFLVRIWGQHQEPIDSRMQFIRVLEDSLAAADVGFELDQFQEVQTAGMTDFSPSIVREFQRNRELDAQAHWRGRTVSLKASFPGEIQVQQQEGKILFQFPGATENLVI